MAYHKDYEWKIGNRTPGARSSNDKDLDRLATTYYVTNFPKHLTARDLWKELEDYGRLLDVYIARKLSKKGKRFTFIRFLIVRDENILDYKLQSVWVGSFHLFISMARFSREKPKRSLDKNNNEAVGRKDNVPNYVNKVYGSSYANVVKGSKVDKQKDDQQSKIVLEAGEYHSVELSHRIALGEVNNATVIPHLIRMCFDEGFDDLKINYIGGMWVWIEFMSSTTCTSFKKNEGVRAHFKHIIEPSNDFVIKERAIWIEIQGMPLCAWSMVEYKKVASMYGNILFSDDELEEHRSSGKICVCSKSKGPINETRTVIVDGKEYEISVREIADWWHDIQQIKEGVGSSSQVEEEDSDEEMDSFDTSENEDKVPTNQENDIRKESDDSPRKKVQEQEKQHQVGQQSEDSDHTFPPGFNGLRFQQRPASSEGIGSTTSIAMQDNKLKLLKKSVSSGSLIEGMEKYIEIGSVLGYDLTGCKEDIGKLIKRMGEKQGVK
ncbi:hypothetical protein CTI12_AA538570 [Artemisia annua]|uniref:RRM domain-containing protein n=1 Tax=Artemisia annua TaxID=35608 RepID=A0A2U1L227_ARTAN|nr:hypothetical protein CTI12_AA538570 [Artemisia annua]